MRKLVLILFIIGVFMILSLFNKKRLQSRFPFLKRMDQTITIISWCLLIAYLLSFGAWIIKEIF
jgi:hypothetical protein